MTPDSQALDPLLAEATALLKALAHPVRLKICCELCRRELSVGEIEGELRIGQPRLSRELSKLRELGLVQTRREAKSIFYSISPEHRIYAMVEAICGVMLGSLAKQKVARKKGGS